MQFRADTVPDAESHLELSCLLQQVDESLAGAETDVEETYARIDRLSESCTAAEFWKAMRISFDELYSLWRHMDADGRAEVERLLSREVLIPSLLTFQEQMTEQAKSCAEKCIYEQLGTICEQYHATSAWIFELSLDGDYLTSRLSFNVPSEHQLIQVGHGIIGGVAETRRPEICNDVSASDKYIELIPSTRAELAMPIVDHRDQLLGVLNLESPDPEAFSSVAFPDMRVSVARLATQLVAMRHIANDTDGQSIWHPSCHGWSSRFLLDELCQEIRTHILGNCHSITVWNCDPAKELLWVRATSGYDYSFLSAETLDYDSFTGSVAMRKRRTPARTNLKRAKQFLHVTKAKRVGLDRIVSCPLDGRRRPASSDSFHGAVNLYSFSQSPGDRAAELPTNSQVSHLAATVLRILRSHSLSRGDVAVQFLTEKLIEREAIAKSVFDVVREVLATCLECDGVSIFVRVGERLVCVATTGLEHIATGSRPAVNGMPAGERWLLDPESFPDSDKWYDIDQDMGYTIHLLHHPLDVMRKIDAPNVGERGSGHGVAPLNKYRERHGLSDTDHRSFMGIGVPGSDVAGVGVIRVVRSSDSQPFAAEDEQLLRQIAVAARPAFVDFVCRNGVDKECRDIAERAANRLLQTAPNQADKSPVSSAVARMVRPLPGFVNTPRRHMRELLQDLCTVFRDLGVLQSSFCVVEGAGNQRRLEMQAFHSVEERGIPDESVFPPARIADGGTRWEALEHNAPMTFVRDDCDCFHPINRASDRVKSGLVFPVTVYGPDECTRGVVALDFSEVVNWRRDALEVVEYGARRISKILGLVVESPIYEHPPEMCIAGLAEFVRSYTGSEWVSMYPNGECRGKPVLHYGPRQPKAVWSRRTVKGSEWDFVLQNGAGGFGVPYMSGASLVGSVCWGGKQAGHGAAEPKLKQLRMYSSAVIQAVATNVLHSRFRRARSRVAPGLRKWLATVSWDREFTRRLGAVSREDAEAFKLQDFIQIDM